MIAIDSMMAANAELHGKILGFLMAEWVRKDNRQLVGVDLLFAPGNGFRDEEVRKWVRADEPDFFADFANVEKFVTQIIEIAEGEADAKPAGKHRFVVRTHQHLGGRASLSFAFAPSYTGSDETELLASGGGGAPQELVADGWLGFDSRSGRLLAGEVNHTGDIMPAGYVAIASRPQIPFRGARLFVHQLIASSFLIHSFRVGTRETTVAAGPIPADAFATRMDALAKIDAMFARDKVIEIKVGKTAAELLGSPWALPIAYPGTEITIAVENIGDRPLRFLAGMLGKVLPP